MVQTICYSDRIVAERGLWAQIDGAIGAAIDRHRGIAERNRTQRMCAGG
jgi:hypothetical protein